MLSLLLPQGEGGAGQGMCWTVAAFNTIFFCCCSPSGARGDQWGRNPLDAAFALLSTNLFEHETQQQQQQTNRGQVCVCADFCSTNRWQIVAYVASHFFNCISLARDRDREREPSKLDVKNKLFTLSHLQSIFLCVCVWLLHFSNLIKNQLRAILFAYSKHTLTHTGHTAYTQCALRIRRVSALIIARGTASSYFTAIRRLTGHN